MLNNIFQVMESSESVIEHIPLFKAFTRRQRQRVASLFVRRTYEPDQAIVTQGSIGVGMYIITSGQADALRTTADGQQVKVSTFGPTDFFGELALLSEGKRTATVIARQPTTCLVLSRSDFLELLGEEATMAIVVAQTLAARFRQEIERTSGF